MWLINKHGKYSHHSIFQIFKWVVRKYFEKKIQNCFSCRWKTGHNPKHFFKSCYFTLTIKRFKNGYHRFNFFGTSNHIPNLQCKYRSQSLWPKRHDLQIWVGSREKMDNGLLQPGQSTNDAGSNRGAGSVHVEIEIMHGWTSS